MVWPFSHSNRKLWLCCVETFGLHIFSKLLETDLAILPSFFNLRQIYLATREKYILQFERNTLCGNFWSAYIFKTSWDWFDDIGSLFNWRSNGRGPFSTQDHKTQKMSPRPISLAHQFLPGLALHISSGYLIYEQIKIWDLLLIWKLTSPVFSLTSQ